MVKIISGIFILCFSMQISASQLEIYQRCYSQLSGMPAPMASNLTASVINGAKTASEACTQILAGASLDPNTGKLATNSILNRSILNNMHQLHSNWFTVADIPSVKGGAASTTLKNIYDASTPAMYFTQALFNPNSSASTPLLANYNLRASRTPPSFRKQVA